ncbi:18144_t:CDS:2, partial [Cetraspora pellucida]
ARVQDIAELEKILKRSIKLLDITHSTIFNSKKYRSDKYEKIRMIVYKQYQKRIINEEKKSILSEFLKVVDLAEQVFSANHAESRLANEINKWHPTSEKINDIIRQTYVEYRHDEH